MKKSELKQLIKEEISKILTENNANPLNKNIPSDVTNLDKAQKSSINVKDRAKDINNIEEFSLAFENWFEMLGFKPGEITKSSIRPAVEKALTKLGYK